jgi:hypothetical protein
MDRGYVDFQRLYVFTLSALGGHLKTGHRGSLQNRPTINR